MPGQYAIYPSLRDKIVVVTGGAEGIGGATVEMFSHQGAGAIIHDISESSAHNFIENIKTDATQMTQIPTFYQCDVTDLSRLKSISEEILQTFSGVKVLVNNAACAGGKARAGTFEVDAEMWQFNVDANLRHQFFLTQFLAPSMKKLGGGSFINMGSISWRIPATGLPIYTTCKAATLGLTRTHA